MTFDEMLMRFAAEIADECEKDESKEKLMNDLEKIVEPGLNGERVDGLELFEICHRFTEAFPDYTAVLIALSLIARIGMDSGAIEFDEAKLKPDFNVDISNIVDGLDSIEMDGEE